MGIYLNPTNQNFYEAVNKEMSINIFVYQDPDALERVPMPICLLPIIQWVVILVISLIH